MSLITSCPACGTMFRVVPDQLKISEGWVRCGHCAEIFDAAAHLGDEAGLRAGAGAAQQPAAGEPEPAFEDLNEQADPTDTVPDDSISGWESTAGTPLASAPATLPPLRAESPAAPIVPPAAPVAPVAPAVPVAPPAAPDSRFGPDSELEASSLDAPFVFRRSDLVDPDPVPSVLPPAPGDSRLDDDHAEAEEDDARVEQVSFVRQARRQAWWRRPLVRVALVLTSFALAALLALQLAYHDRDRLAATRPGLLPVLQEMCDQLGCTLGQPRQIEAIAIESSGFNRVRPDTYRLSFNVRNTSASRVATPALELTLTDLQDQPLVRRVLTPAEMGRNDGAIGPGAEWTGAVGVAIAPGSAGRIAGYRLLAFYP